MMTQLFTLTEAKQIGHCDGYTKDNKFTGTNIFQANLTYNQVSYSVTYGINGFKEIIYVNITDEKEAEKLAILGWDETRIQK